MTIDTSIKSLNGWVFMDDYGQLYTCHGWLAELQTMKQALRDVLPLVDQLQLSLNDDLRKRIEKVI